MRLHSPRGAAFVPVASPNRRRWFLSTLCILCVVLLALSWPSVPVTMSVRVVDDEDHEEPVVAAKLRGKCLSTLTLLPSVIAACAAAQPDALEHPGVGEVARTIAVELLGNGSCGIATTDAAAALMAGFAQEPLCRMNPCAMHATAGGVLLPPMPERRRRYEALRDKARACRLSRSDNVTEVYSLATPPSGPIRKGGSKRSWLRLASSPSCQGFADALTSRRLDAEALRNDIITMLHGMTPETSAAIVNRAGLRDPVHIFIGDSMMRQFVQRLIAAIRLAGVDAPHFDVTTRNDLCYRFYADGSDELELFAAPRADSDSVLALASKHTQDLTRMQARFDKLDPAIGDRPRRRGRSTDRDFANVSESLAASRLSSRRGGAFNRRGGQRDNITKCGARKNADGSAAPLFTIAFLWNPETWMFRSDFVDMQPAVTHTAAFMYWERQLSPAYWSLLDLVYAKQVRGASTLRPEAAADLYDAVHVWAANATADRSVDIHAEARTASRELYEARVAAASHRLRRVLALRRDEREGDRQAAAAAPVPTRYVQIDIPYTYRHRVSVINESDGNSEAATNAADCAAQSLLLRSGRTATLRINTRLGSTLDDEDSNIAAKNRRTAHSVRLLDAELKQAGAGRASVLSLNSVAAGLEDGAFRADGHHFSCRVKPAQLSFSQRATFPRLLVAVNASSRRSESRTQGGERSGAVAQGLDGLLERRTLLRRGASVAEDPLPPACRAASCNVTAAQAADLRRRRCTDNVNLVAVLAWFIEVL
jgi:hypothetical protein